MFRIRRIYDLALPINAETVAQVQDILRTQFKGVSENDIDKLPEQLRNPMKYRFRSILFVADGTKGQVKGFALLSHEPVLNFCYIDFMSTAKYGMGRGIGGAIYERVREEALSFKSIGLFLECLPDDPALCRNPETLKQNAARLRFYERYGARPIANTAYETPVKPGDDCPPYLIYDNLGQDAELSLKDARVIVRAILERKYGDVCPREYTDMVVDSFQDDPVRIRTPRYVKKDVKIPVSVSVPLDKRIALVITDQHSIHHVHERGYVESPARIGSILKELERTDLFWKFTPRHFSEKHIRAVHDADFVEYFKKVCANIKPGEAVYPYVFPIRNISRPPKSLPIRAGYYCIDTFTPISSNAYRAAKRAVDCTMTAAERILAGHRLAYALVRPPGHHAERRSFGGFCYFNSAAIAAQYLSRYGRVAILDLDHHHGNGQQYIFYDRSDVFTISIHGHPNFTYPYFSGFRDEKGDGAGKGYNLNIPLGLNIDGKQYYKVLQGVLHRLERFRPRFVIIALGVDTAKSDPTGTWELRAKDFELNGRLIGSLHLPTLVVQEGGYSTRVLGTNVRSFLSGLWAGTYSA